MYKYKHYYVKGYYDFIRDKGDYYAINLYDLFSGCAKINYHEDENLDFDKLDEEINRSKTILYGDYEIILLED